MSSEVRELKRHLKTIERKSVLDIQQAQTSQNINGSVKVDASKVYVGFVDARHAVNSLRKRIQEQIR
ncbi:hypothetical protein SAMN05720615_11336 [Stenotrophomonas indicatrix]|nr:hypothetical protein SAMN05720615_11336 [Stenotrophomonas indicatrix]